MSLRMWWKNLKLRKARWSFEREWHRQAKEVTRKKQPELMEEWWAIHGWEVNALDEELRHNDSSALLTRAERLYLPHPQMGDKSKWVSRDDLLTPQFHWRILTPEARQELVAAIRKEKRERREVLEWWIKIGGAGLALATGLIGSIIGLVATLHPK